MDRTEAFAKRFLESLGHENLIYEPDGNVPPDFLTDDGTAIEVRKLNQAHVDEDGKVQPLETADAALWRTMRSLLHAYKPPIATNTTYGVFYHFKRPIPVRRVVERELKAELDQFLSGSGNTKEVRTLPCGLKLNFYDLQTVDGPPFMLAGNLDKQRGGWVVQQLETAIRYALADKDSKVRAFKEKYPRWWLVLVDHVSWGLDENDHRQLRGTGPFAHSFDKVLIVNAERLDDYFEL